MRYRIFLAFLIFSLSVGFAFAQDDGGKGLPGEDETPTPAPTEEDEPIETEEPDEPDVDVDFPSTMLLEAGESIPEGELVLYEPFDDEDAWEIGEYERGSLTIDDGQYIVAAFEESVLFWGQNSDEHSDVVIQVTTEQLSREDNNGFGIMCRADPANNLDGYHLWISGDGYATIFGFENEGEDYFDIVEWTATDAINQGRDTNEVVAVCYGEYLALFVNGELAVEAYDDTYSEGVAGFGTAVFEEGEDSEIAFDDVYIWEIGGSSRDSNSNNNNNDNSSIRGLATDPEVLAGTVADMLEQGDEPIELGDVLFSDSFESQGAWDLFDEDETTIEVDNGVYFLEESGDGIFSWGFNADEEEYDDAVIHVDSVFLAEDDSNAYGVMCRLQTDGSGDGYYFLISGDGYYRIGYWEDDSAYDLIEFTRSSAIETGEGAENSMTAVCMGRYLAFYINDELVDEITDRTFSSGTTALAVVSFNGEAATVEFDNLLVWEATD